MPASFDRRTIGILALCQGLFICSQTTLIFVSGLVGYALASDKALATLPISMTILGTAASTIPASLFMRAVGRRLGFTVGGLIGLLGACTSALAVYLASFPLFCFGTLLMGCYNAFCQYYRFAAADSVGESHRARAISYVLAGGVVVGFVGPSLANATRDLLAPVAWVGSYLALAGLCALSILLLQFVRLPHLTADQRSRSGRPLVRIMAQPAFIVAVLTSMIAYAVMSLIMTATPLAMIGCGFHATDAGTVIQWHVLGMFVPSFFSGYLIDRLGLIPVMAAGVGLLAVTVGLTLSGIDMLNFWLGLLLLGVGWNFLFVGGTALLTRTYAPEERAKTQAANDFLVFGATATASLMSGTLLHWTGWTGVNLGAVPLVAIVGIVLLWHQRLRRAAAQAG